MEQWTQTLSLIDVWVREWGLGGLIGGREGCAVSSLSRRKARWRSQGLKKQKMREGGRKGGDIVQIHVRHFPSSATQVSAWWKVAMYQWAHLIIVVLFWLIDLEYVVKEQIYALFNLFRHAVIISLPAGRRQSSSGATPTSPNKILRAKIVLPHVGYICIAGSNLSLSYTKSLSLVSFQYIYYIYIIYMMKGQASPSLPFTPLRTSSSGLCPDEDVFV